MKNEPASLSFPPSPMWASRIHPFVSFIFIILSHLNKRRKEDAIFCNQEPKVTRCWAWLRCSYWFFLNCKLPKDCARRPGNLLFHLSRFSNQQSKAAKRCHDGSRLGEHILFHLSAGLSNHIAWVLWRVWQNYIFSSKTAWRPLNAKWLWKIPTASLSTSLCQGETNTKMRKQKSS